MPELKPLDGTDYYIWKYLPSIPLAAAFGGAFLLVTVVHVVRTVRTGTHFNHIFGSLAPCPTNRPNPLFPCAISDTSLTPLQQH